MDSRGDLLLYAVTAGRELSWRAFGNALDALFVADERVAQDVKHVRSAVAALGDALGHWEVVPDGSSARICIAPPVIAALPQPGRPTAVLCGSRSPDTLEAVSRACRPNGVEVRAFGQSHLHPYAPSRIELTADSTEPIARAAHALQISFRPRPPAWALATACGAVGDYIASLPWSPDPELNWPRRDFEPELLRFVLVNGRRDRGSGLSLSAYEHPSGWERLDRLWRSGESAPIDRNWGRYAVLFDRGIKVMRFDHPRGVASVPVQVPLPRISARALALCSGRPPAIEPGEGLGSLAYSGVPARVFETLARKLGQDGSSSAGEREKVTLR